MTSTERGPSPAYDLAAVIARRREVDAAVRAGVASDASSDELFASLNREATLAKAAGNWTKAVELIQRAKLLAGESYHDTRLAKFLQYAGMVDEALAEVEWLLERSLKWAKATHGHSATTVVLEHHARWSASICRTAAAIFKRAKRPDLQASFEQRWNGYLELVDKLHEINEARKDARRREREGAQQAGRQAMLEFREKSEAEQSENLRRNQPTS